MAVKDRTNVYLEGPYPMPDAIRRLLGLGTAQEIRDALEVDGTPEIIGRRNSAGARWVVDVSPETYAVAIRDRGFVTYRDANLNVMTHDQALTYITRSEYQDRPEEDKNPVRREAITPLAASAITLDFEPPAVTHSAPPAIEEPKKPVLKRAASYIASVPRRVFNWFKSWWA